MAPNSSFLCAMRFPCCCFQQVGFISLSYGIMAVLVSCVDQQNAVEVSALWEFKVTA